MRISVSTRNTLQETSADLVVAAVTKPFDRSAADLGMPAAAAEALVAEARRIGFDGDLGTSVFASHGGAWYALAGAGASPRPTDFRRVGSRVVALARQLQARTAAVLGLVGGDRARAVAEGAHLAGYRFDAYKTKSGDEDKRPRLGAVILVGDAAVAEGARLGSELAEAVMVARDVANEHPGVCTPRWLADQAAAIAARLGLVCTIFDEHQLEEKGFRLHLAVSRGSTEPARFIHAVYRAEGEIRRRIALVGKGVTFDTGGYSLKPPPSQLNMHLDMGGGAAVVGAMEAIGRLKPAGVEVHFLVPAAENCVAGNAYKVNEVIRGLAGPSVEIHNTDAEGRLLLADALSFATGTLQVDEVIDLATLTGACVVALGLETAGAFSPDDALAARLLEAADAADESIWRMPLTERMNDQIKSDVADIKNVGSRWGGAITAALFLKHFVGDTPWLHLDIAGPAMTEGEWEYINRGGTGFGVLTLAEYVRRAGMA